MHRRSWPLPLVVKPAFEGSSVGVSIVIVEQNAARCLQVCDRAFVLDQGTNAYEGTGRDLLNDPKVIELYLGTLAKARDADVEHDL